MTGAKHDRQLRALRQLMPWNWDSRIDEHPPGEKAMHDFENVLSCSFSRTRRRRSEPPVPPPIPNTIASTPIQDTRSAQAPATAPVPKGAPILESQPTTDPAPKRKLSLSGFARTPSHKRRLSGLPRLESAELKTPLAPQSEPRAQSEDVQDKKNPLDSFAERQRDVVAVPRCQLLTPEPPRATAEASPVPKPAAAAAVLDLTQDVKVCTPSSAKHASSAAKMVLTPSRRINCTLSPANCAKPVPPCQPALAENAPVLAARQGSFPAAKAADQVESKTGAVPLVDAVRAPSLSPGKALEKASALELSSTGLEPGLNDKASARSFAMENRLAKSASLKPLKNEPNGKPGQDLPLFVQLQKPVVACSPPESGPASSRLPCPPLFKTSHTADRVELTKTPRATEAAQKACRPRAAAWTPLNCQEIEYLSRTYHARERQILRALALFSSQVSGK